MNSYPQDPGSRREIDGSTEEIDIEQGGNEGSFTCCGKTFKSQLGMRIHQGRICMKAVQKCRTSVRKTRASVAQEANHSGDSNTPVPPSEEIRLQVKWPKSSDTKAYQELEKQVLKKYKRLKKGASTQERLEALSDTIYRYVSDTSDVLVRRLQEPKKYQPSRRSRKLTELRAQKKSLRKCWLNAEGSEI